MQCPPGQDPPPAAEAQMETSAQAQWQAPPGALFVTKQGHFLAFSPSLQLHNGHSAVEEPQAVPRHCHRCPGWTGSQCVGTVSSLLVPGSVWGNRRHQHP